MKTFIIETNVLADPIVWTGESKHDAMSIADAMYMQPYCDYVHVYEQAPFKTDVSILIYKHG